MRQYEPIWTAIKRNNHASIVASIRSQAKIIKAVVKEKNIDTGYKLELSDKCLKAKLIVAIDKKNKKLITFSLEITINQKYIGVSNL